MNLLVSVRSQIEASAALVGGADLIDVKEPLRGPLGRADDDLIAAIAWMIGGLRRVSAAMGELADFAGNLPPTPLAYLKWGLSRCRGLPWREKLLALRETTRATVVPTAYADAERAEAPPIDEVAAFAINAGFPILLIDTWDKDGRGLFSWTSADDLARLAAALHARDAALALAGSLKIDDLPALRQINADWMAVRGCVCTAGLREKSVAEMYVRLLRWEIDHGAGGEPTD
jgi:uncharacterized protein (UPF0264 family)